MEAHLTARVRAALAALPGLPDGFDAAVVAVEWSAPAKAEHGDLATNVALQLARPLRRAPRAVAEALAEALDVDPALVAGVEVAGPGFLNVRFAPGYLAAGLRGLLAAGDAYGRTDTHAGETAIVEYVSANPTGPLTVGHGRNAVLGDTLANLLDWTGYAVTREYYFNDAGRQMRVLGQSVRARYIEQFIDEDINVSSRPLRSYDVDPEQREKIRELVHTLSFQYKGLDYGDGVVKRVPTYFPDDVLLFPDGGYEGDYIIDIASRLKQEHRGRLLLSLDEVEPFTEAAKAAIFAEINATLKRLGVVMDEQFNEHDLYTSGAVQNVVDRLTKEGLAYKHDGAVWFKTGSLGKTVEDAEGVRAVDVVLVKSTGEPTYRLPDIAYHLEKLERGFDLVLDVFGADHIATYPDVLRGVEALGGDASKIDVVVYQFVTLVRGGQAVKMSTRKATYVTLDELIGMVGADVTRFFFLMRSPNTHLEFDLDLAVEASEKNPVFYLQYAHARICSIAAKAAETGLPNVRGADGQGADVSLLTHESEVALVKTLLLFPGEVRAAAEGRAPHRLAGFLREVAVAFSQFYRDCRIVGEPADIAAARLHLAEATRRVLGHGLAILGLSAPERMDREEAVEEPA